MSAPEEELDSYVETQGPGIPELPQGATDEQLTGLRGDVQVPLYPGWEEDTVREFLLGAGAGLHLMLSDAEAERSWLMTQEDLRRIAPPLTRIANRWEPALRLSPYADPFLVAKGLALYGWRSALEDARARRDRQLTGAQGDGYARPAPAPSAAQGAAGGEQDTVEFAAQDGALHFGDDWQPPTPEDQ